MKYFATLGAKRWATAIATLVLAFLSGHIMQSEIEASQFHKQAATIVAPADPKPVQMGLQAPPLLTSRVLETRAPRSPGCEPHLEMSEMATGMVRVSLVTRCHLKRALTVSINGLKADIVTDASGNWEAVLPALSSRMIAKFQFGETTIEKQLDVSSSESFQHVLLLWNGVQTFRIHVESHGEFDGDFEKNLIRIGSGDGAAFEVFSFPSTSGIGNSVLRLAVDATVTKDNCGKRASVTAYQTGFSGRLRPTEISYTMPECARVGDTVRLQNLFRDMRLAAR